MEFGGGVLAAPVYFFKPNFMMLNDAGTMAWRHSGRRMV